MTMYLPRGPKVDMPEPRPAASKNRPTLLATGQPNIKHDARSISRRGWNSFWAARFDEPEPRAVPPVPSDPLRSATAPYAPRPQLSTARELYSTGLRMATLVEGSRPLSLWPSGSQPPGLRTNSNSSRRRQRPPFGYGGTTITDWPHHPRRMPLMRKRMATTAFFAASARATRRSRIA